MDGIETGLKKQHKFVDFLYWNMVVALPIIAACIGIFKESPVWMFIYLIICILLVAVIYRFYCTHCPHYLMMRRNNNISAQFFLKCLNYSLVKGNSTLKYYRRLNILP